MDDTALNFDVDISLEALSESLGVDEIASWRRHLHSHPELMFDVFETASFIAAKLTEFGCDKVVAEIGRVGVVGVISGKNASSGKVIGLRAELDALPITEESGVQYTSHDSGLMHACGHDGHMAMLLGVARFFCRNRDFNGTIVLVFQPAEEGGGGAKVMVDDGLIQRFKINEIYGMHNRPGLPIGAFSTREGPLLASVDDFEIQVVGRGGHAAMPHQAADPIVAACAIVTALQTAVSRNIDPIESGAVTVGSIVSSSMANNVIAETVTLKGTVRTLNNPTRERLETSVARIVSATASAHGVEAILKYHRNYPVTVNHPRQTQFSIFAAEKVGRFVLARPTLGGEDFAFMLEACPGSMIFVGNGNSYPLHHPKYDFDDSAILSGCAYWIQLAQSRLRAETNRSPFRNTSRTS